MRIHSSYDNPATLVGVENTNSFRIKSSAHAFRILSSGLYANKIRAVIRELSTNARDSHTAAGRAHLPFDLHLPTALEPWFSVRDYGTGLDHDQVTNIYTTYFESTKTDSNDFVGCLGLGSKSPFAVTENFTVTAIKDKVKRIYTAYVSDHGVPSVALMTTSETDEPNGLEVQFAMNDTSLISHYLREASSLFTFFEVVPNFTGGTPPLQKIDIDEKDIIPGVDLAKGSGSAYAVMGGITYPIDVPNSNTVLGNLDYLCNLPLYIRFNVGELDIQPSREGLSYIGSTVDAIRDRLEQVHGALYARFEQKIASFTNVWAQADYIAECKDHPVYSKLVHSWLVKNPGANPFWKPGNFSGLIRTSIEVDIVEAARKYNIAIAGYYVSSRCRVEKVEVHEARSEVAGDAEYKKVYAIQASPQTVFVRNDIKAGGKRRAAAKYTKYGCRFYLLEPSDKAKPALYDEFLKSIHSPTNVVTASELPAVAPLSSGRSTPVPILKISTVDTYRYYARGNSTADTFVWRQAGNASDFSGTDTYYYLPLSGYNLETKYGAMSTKTLVYWLKTCGLPAIENLEIYGVQKGGIEQVSKLKNWVNLEDYVSKILSATTKDSTQVFNAALKSYNWAYKRLPKSILGLITDDKSPIKPIISGLNADYDDSETHHTSATLDRLVTRYHPKSSSATSFSSRINAAKQDIDAVFARYPLIARLSAYPSPDDVQAIADYINLIDSTQK